MEKAKIKIIKKSTVDRRRDFEQSVEVNHMIVLIQRYPNKALAVVKKIFDKSTVLN